MAWPPASNGTTYTTRGTAITTLAWGTDGIYQAIVKNIRYKVLAEEANIPNGTGLTAQQIALNDGKEVEITCEDDRNLVWPDFMGVANIVDASNITNAAPNISLQVLSNDYNAARKQNGERVLLAKKYTLITPA